MRNSQRNFQILCYNYSLIYSYQIKINHNGMNPRAVVFNSKSDACHARMNSDVHCKTTC